VDTVAAAELGGVLDLGCGRAKEPGAFGVDLDPASGADLIADLDALPLPLPAGRFRRIVCRHVVEHVADIPALFKEIHRLAKPGARIEIVTPHFSNRCSYTDPTHRRHLSVQFIDWFAPRPDARPATGCLGLGLNYLFEHRYDYPTAGDPPRFAFISQRLSFSRIFRLLGIEFLANRYYRFWEFYLAFLLPARDMTFVLEALPGDRP
jgi:SAM-dependent methyltransferase